MSDQAAPREEPRAPASHGAEEVQSEIAALRRVAANYIPRGDIDRLCGLLARLARERDEAITENIALEKDKRTLATGMDVLRADLATARERIALLEELNGKRYEEAKAMLGGYDRENADLRARLDSARAILEEARERLSFSPKMRARIDSWLASGGKTTTASPEADRSIP